MREPAKRAAPEGGPREAQTWQGRELVDRLGHKVGRIEAWFADAELQTPGWAVVRTGLPSTRRTLVPMTQARLIGERVRLPYDKQHMMRGPRSFEPEQLFARGGRVHLSRHYGVEQSQRRTGDAAAERDAVAAKDPEAPEARPIATAQRAPAPTGRHQAGREARGPTQDGAMTRSEEELRVGTAWRECARVRVRKYVVIEEVQFTVPVRREEIDIEYESTVGERLDGAGPGKALSTDELEIVLHEEVPVVEKRVVPRERVRVITEARASHAELREDVRKERIEAESDLYLPGDEQAEPRRSGGRGGAAT